MVLNPRASPGPFFPGQAPGNRPADWCGARRSQLNHNFSSAVAEREGGLNSFFEDLSYKFFLFLKTLNRKPDEGNEFHNIRFSGCTLVSCAGSFYLINHIHI